MAAIARRRTGDEASCSALAAAVEADSEHPLARAIVAEARRVVAPGPRQRPTSRPSPAAAPGPRSAAARSRSAARGSSTDLGLAAACAESDAVGSGRAGRCSTSWSTAASSARSALEDEIRPESAEAVGDLHALGVRVAMITGDSQAVAESVARRLGIDEVAAQVLPADKAAAVTRFQEGGRTGRHGRRRRQRCPRARARRTSASRSARARTSPSNRPASCSCGATHATWSAPSRCRGPTYRKMLQNLVWATGYNIVAIPLAAGVLVPWGIDLPMALGAVADERSRRSSWPPTPSCCGGRSYDPATPSEPGAVVGDPARSSGRRAEIARCRPSVSTATLTSSAPVARRRSRRWAIDGYREWM